MRHLPEMLRDSVNPWSGNRKLPSHSSRSLGETPSFSFPNTTAVFTPKSTSSMQFVVCSVVAKTRKPEAFNWATQSSLLLYSESFTHFSDPRDTERTDLRAGHVRVEMRCKVSMPYASAVRNTAERFPESSTSSSTIEIPRIRLDMICSKSALRFALRHDDNNCEQCQLILWRKPCKNERYDGLERNHCLICKRKTQDNHFDLPAGT